MSITSFSSPNFAPLQPLLDLRDNPQRKPPNDYFCDAIRERFTDCLARHKEERREIISNGQLIALMLEGQGMLAFNPYAGAWTVRRPKQETTETRRWLNVLQKTATEYIARWQGSNPDIILAATRETEDTYGAVKAANMVLDKYEEKLYIATLTEQEALHNFTFGNALLQLYLDPKKSNIILREVFEDKEIPLDDGYGSCACGKEGVYAEFAKADGQEACPDCGGQMLYTQPPRTEIMSVPTEPEQINVGDLGIRLLPFPACHWDLEQRPEESDWFIFRQNIPLGRVRALLGDVKIPGEADGEDFGLQVVKSLAHSGSPIAGGERSSRQADAAIWKDQVTEDLFYLGVEDYGDIKLKREAATISGQTIRADVPLGQQFSEQIGFTGLNGMKLITGVYPGESHQHTVSSNTYHQKPLSGTGRAGGTDVVEVVKRINKFDNQVIRVFDAMGSPGGAYDKLAIAPGMADKIGQAGLFVPVDAQAVGGIKNAVQQFEPGRVSNQMLDYGQNFLRTMMDVTSHMFNLDNAQGGVDVNTLGGQELAHQLAQTILTPMLLRKVESRIRAGKNILRLVKQHLPPEVIARMLGRDGEMLTQSFFALDFEQDLSWSAREGSELPRNPYTRRKEMESFLVFWGGAEGLNQALSTMPALVAESARAFNVELSSIPTNALRQRSQMRYDSMKAAFQAGIQDPLAILAQMQPPLAISEGNLANKLAFFQELLDSDDLFKPENMPLRQAVDLAVQTHFQVDGQQQAARAGQAGEAQMAAAQPQAAMTAEMQQAQAAQAPTEQSGAMGAK